MASFNVNELSLNDLAIFIIVSGVFVIGILTALAIIVARR